MLHVSGQRGPSFNSLTAPERDKGAFLFTRHCTCTVDLFISGWPPLPSTQSTTACTPSKHISSSLCCHTASMTLLATLAPRVRVPGSPERQGILVTKTPPGTPSACAPHPANGVRMSNKSYSLSLNHPATDVQEVWKLILG